MTLNSYHGDVLAEETHSGRIWGLVILPGILMPALSTVFRPTGPSLIALSAVIAIGGGVLALTWSGFHYRFLRDGVEIRTLGFRLRTIPRQAILGYAIEPWTLARGFGIRGIGRTRAYVWGNKVVHIQTTNGEVFLGHSEPERIIRDLNLVTGFVTRG